MATLIERFEEKGYAGTAAGWMERAADAAEILADYLEATEPRAIAAIRGLRDAAELLVTYAGDLEE